MPGGIANGFKLLAVLVLATLLYPLPIHMMNALWTADSFNSVYLWTTLPPLASVALFAMLVRRAAQSAFLHALPPRSPGPASYIHLPAATPLVRLHDGRLSPSRVVSGR